LRIAHPPALAGCFLGAVGFANRYLRRLSFGLAPNLQECACVIRYAVRPLGNANYFACIDTVLDFHVDVDRKPHHEDCSSGGGILRNKAN
jgi:hypothetical protein